MPRPARPAGERSAILNTWVPQHHASATTAPARQMGTPLEMVGLAQLGAVQGGALPLIRKCMHMDTGTRVDQWHGHLTEGLSCTPLVPPCADPIESAGKVLKSKLSVQQALQLRQPSQPGVTSLSPAGVGGPHSADLPGCVGVPRSHRQGAGSSGQPDPAAAPQAAAAQVCESQ